MRFKQYGWKITIYSEQGMAGSITTILLLQITLSTISATPLYIETDEGLLIGTDTAPIQVRYQKNNSALSALKIPKL